MSQGPHLVTFEERCSQILKEKVTAITQSKKVSESQLELYLVDTFPSKRLNRLLSGLRKEGSLDAPKYTKVGSSCYYDPSDVFAWAREKRYKLEPTLKKDWFPDPKFFPYTETLESNRLKAALDEVETLRLELRASRHRIEKMETVLSNARVHSDASGLTNQGMVLANARPVFRIRGIYFLVRRDTIVYVGQSKNIVGRVGMHLSDKDFDAYSYIEIASGDLDMPERKYIEKFKPEYNMQFSCRNQYAPIEESC